MDMVSFINILLIYIILILVQESLIQKENSVFGHVFSRVAMKKSVEL